MPESQVLQFQVFAQFWGNKEIHVDVHVRKSGSSGERPGNCKQE